MADIKARWTRGNRLVVESDALYDGNRVHVMSAESAECHCAMMLRAVRARVVGLLIDYRSVSPLLSSKPFNARLVVGDRRIKWCPFCGALARMSRPRYVLEERLP